MNDGASVGTAVLLVGLTIGIAVGLKSKKLTITELSVCGVWGLLIGTTALGAALQGPIARFGTWLLNLAG